MPHLPVSFQPSNDVFQVCERCQNSLTFGASRDKQAHCLYPLISKEKKHTMMDAIEQVKNNAIPSLLIIDSHMHTCDHWRQ